MNHSIQELHAALQAMRSRPLFRRWPEDLQVVLDDPVRARLVRLEAGLQEWIDEHRPEAVAIERVFAQHNLHSVADTMQAAGYLIAIAAELAAGMQYGQNDLNGRLAAFMHIDRNATAIINNRDAVILLDGYIDMAAITSQGLID